MTMFEPGSSLWRWLAEQPACTEVGVGMWFVLMIAPGVLTAVAVALTHLEAIVEGIAVRLVQGELPLWSGTQRTRLPFREQ
jgi:hypothetical protein